jgi:Tfp pilus assembly protein PilX
VIDRHRRDRSSLASFERERGRDGSALPAVLLALLLLAALIAGAFSAVTEETRIGVAAVGRETALATAETAIEVAIAAISSSLGDDPIGVGETRQRGVEQFGAPADVYVTRLDSSVYWVVADAGSTSPNSGIARRVGVLVRVTKEPGGSIRIDRIPERGWSELF